MQLVVFILCSAAGYGVGQFLPEGAWAAFGSILVSYHLFLGWLVLTAKHEKGFSLPIFSAIMTHTACLAVVVCIGMGRHYVPFFGIVRYFIPAIAPFETKWLFSGGGSKKQPEPMYVPSHAPVVRETAEDYEEWLRYLNTRNPHSVKVGMSIQEEYKQFIAKRAKNRPAAPSGSVSA
jgi:hypothetical protein